MPDNHHPGRQVRGRLPRAEGSQARHELIWITAPVGMVRPDELPTAALGFVHPPLTGLTAATCVVSSEGYRRVVPSGLIVTVLATARKHRGRSGSDVPPGTAAQSRTARRSARRVAGARPLHQQQRGVITQAASLMVQHGPRQAPQQFLGRPAAGGFPF